MNAGFRLSVESVVLRKFPHSAAEILLVKRASGCKVAPNVWNVPAGKVNLLETTRTAVVRETFEETALTVEVVKLLAENAFEIQSSGEKAYRNMFTYLTKQLDVDQIVKLNDEHTEYKWTTKDEIERGGYESLMPRLKDILLEVFNHES